MRFFLFHCTFSQNNASRRHSPNATSSYIGVSWDKRRRKWGAAIRKNGISKDLGLFDTEGAAGRPPAGADPRVRPDGVKQNHEAHEGPEEGSSPKVRGA